ncbi:16756_t:CDS:1 [Acaulospora colombiana]|uniref:16756_t:CDS:1 n=1 Tax=Acaulospora colombiana TaxID=27376 RepID=A0ACA9K9N9_9GLOM|nr:16756_t:CDS:1 [Acaulospora colombiana]
MVFSGEIIRSGDLDFEKFDYVVVHRSNNSVGEKSIEQKLEEFEVKEFVGEKGHNVKKYWELIGIFSPPPEFRIEFLHKTSEGLFGKYYESKEFTNYIYRITKGLSKHFVDTHNNNDNFDHNLLELYTIGILRRFEKRSVGEILFVPRTRKMYPRELRIDIKEI